MPRKLANFQLTIGSAFLSTLLLILATVLNPFLFTGDTDPKISPENGLSWGVIYTIIFGFDFRFSSTAILPRATMNAILLSNCNDSCAANIDQSRFACGLSP